jgi:hypothetical protein
MQKRIYNLEFPSWCPAMTIYGYRFTRVEDYAEKVLRLQHLAPKQWEFRVFPTMGEHTKTAYVDLPEQEDKAVLEWSNPNSTALQDVLFLLSIFGGRDVFLSERDEADEVYLADPRSYHGGGVLRCSLPYKASQTKSSKQDISCNIGVEEGINQVYSLMRSKEWLQKYKRGYFLMLARQAFYEQPIESAFTQCWTVWEHLFTILNQNWLSDRQIIQLDSSEKIAFIMTEFALKGEIDDPSRKRIKSLAEIRNRLIHFGKFPERDAVNDDAVLFVRLTEFVIAKILGLSPSNVFNTTENLERFLGLIESPKSIERPT